MDSAPPETLFRLLCPASTTGSLIGKGGAFVRHIRDLTGARVRIDDSSSSAADEERLILITAAADRRRRSSSPDDSGSDPPPPPLSAAQKALLMLFEKAAEGGGGGEAAAEVVCCRILAAGSQIGCVLGRGGRIVEKIRQESGAQVRVFGFDDRIPPCASPGDELIQITGNISAVKKALISVSGCLQDKPRLDSVGSGSGRLSGRSHHGPGPENIGGGHRMFIEEDVVYKLLCQVDKVGSLIGKGGSVIRHLQNETGAYIKISDSPSDSDERVVVISARENSEQKHSPTQEAVIRVHSRIAEIGFEPGSAVVARLLVHSQQIGCLLGKGGHIISEMRRATGASIRIFTNDQVPKCASANDEVVQVIGNMQCVQDALFHITGRLRETIIPIKPHHPNFDGPPYMSPYSDMPPPMFRSRHYPGSPGPSPSPVGQPHDYPHGYSHAMDHNGPYPYGSDRLGPGREYGRQVGGCGTPRGSGDGGFGPRKGHSGSDNQAHHYNNSNLEIMVPQNLLPHVYGDNNTNLAQICQISGAQVVVSDINPGAVEGLVTISGTPSQISVAKCLVHAFILHGQTPG